MATRAKTNKEFTSSEIKIVATPKSKKNLAEIAEVLEAFAAELSVRWGSEEVGLIGPVRNLSVQNSVLPMIDGRSKV